MNHLPLQQKQADHAAQESSHAEQEGKGKSLAPPAFQLTASDSPAAPPPAQLKQSSGGMPSDLVSGFAATTGHDLSDVNVVRNSDKPAQVGALAFAQGNDIHLAPGQEQHLAHEAGHIVQQREGRVQANTEVNGKPVNDQHSLEHEADALGAKAMQLKSAAHQNPVSPQTAVASGPVQRVATPTPQDYKDYATIMAMAVDDFEAYTQKQADWHAGPALNDAQRDEIRTILQFARSGDLLSGLIGMTMSAVQAEIATNGKTDTFKYLEHYCKAVRQEPFEITGTSVVTEAINIGKSLAALKAGFPDWVLKSSMKEKQFNAIRTNHLEADVVNYFTTSKPQPTFEASNGADFKSYMAMRLVDKKDPLSYNIAPIAGNIRNFHRFQADVFEQLKTNYNDFSKKKPLLLVLHSALDHNGAFHREPGFTRVITNKANNVIMLEGKEKLADIEGEIPAIAKKYGQNDKIDQVMVAGHGEANYMQLGGSFVENTTTGKGKEVNDAVSPDGNTAHTDSLFKAILDNMDKTGDKGKAAPHRRIAFNACLTNSHDMSGEAFDADPAIARGEINAYLGQPRNLVDWIEKKGADNGNAGIKGVGSLASFGWAEYINKAGQLDIISSDDPMLTSTKLNYVREGIEPAGALRATLECWAKQPKECKAAMKTRISKPKNSWDGVIIQTAYDMIIKSHWDDAGKINTIGDFAGTLSERKHDDECRVNTLRDWPTKEPTIFNGIMTALTASQNWKADSFIPLVMYQPWMTNSKYISADADIDEMFDDSIKSAATKEKDKANVELSDAKTHLATARQDLKKAQDAQALLLKDTKSSPDDIKAAGESVKTIKEGIAKLEVLVAAADKKAKEALAKEKAAQAQYTKSAGAAKNAALSHQAKANGFLTQLSSKFNCNTAKKYVDIPYLESHGHLATLLAGAPSKGKLMLALLGVIDSTQADCKKYLEALVVGDAFPATLNVKALLAGLATEDEILIMIGKKSAPSMAPVVTSTNIDANVTLKGGTQNTEQVQSVTKEGEIVAPDAKVFKESSCTNEIGKLALGAKVHILGSTATSVAIEYFHSDLKVQGTGFLQTPCVKVL